VAKSEGRTPPPLPTGKGARTERSQRRSTCCRDPPAKMLMRGPEDHMCRRYVFQGLPSLRAKKISWVARRTTHCPLSLVPFGQTNHLTPSPNTTQSILGETVRGAGQAASPWKSVKFEAELPEGFPERTANASRRVSLSRTSRLSGLSLVFLVFGCMWLSRVLHIFSQKIFKSLMGDLGEEL
jgi:hypothetical protein